MADQFTRAPKKQTGGSTVDVWISDCYNGNKFEGKENISTISASGQVITKPVKDACLVLYDVAWLRNKQLNHNKQEIDMDVATNYGALTGKIYRGYFDHKETIRSIFDGNERNANFTLKNLKVPVWIPLGLVQTNPTNLADQAVYHASARWAMSLGRNNIEGTDEHVANMYMSVLQTIAYQIFTETEYGNREWLINTFVLVTKAADRYFKAYPTAYKVIEPLSYALEAQDILQRTISFLFTREMSREDQLRIVEVALKRMNKRNELDLIKNSPGVFACLFLIPAVKTEMLGQSVNEQKEGIPTEEAKGSRINAIIQDNTLKVVESMIKATQAEGELSTKKEKNIKVLKTMFDVAFGVDVLSREQVTRYYDHIAAKNNHKTPAPLDDWKMIASKDTDIKMNLQTFRNNNQRTGNYAYIVRATKKTATVVASSPSEWCGLQLGVGKYKVNCTNLGNSEQAIGNSSGQEQKALIRFTSGDDIFPRGSDGMSSAGIKCTFIGNRADYVDTRKILRLDQSFVLTNKADVVTIEQNGDMFYRYAVVNRKAPMIGFKFVVFDIEKLDEVVANNLGKEEKKEEHNEDDNEPGMDDKKLTASELLKRMKLV